MFWYRASSSINLPVPSIYAGPLRTKLEVILAGIPFVVRLRGYGRTYGFVCFH